MWHIGLFFSLIIINNIFNIQISVFVKINNNTDIAIVEEQHNLKYLF